MRGRCRVVTQVAMCVALGAPVAACHHDAASSPPVVPPRRTIVFSGRNGSDPPLPVGFEDQLFATVRDSAGAAISIPVDWRSDAPAVARIDSSGVVTALAPGTLVVRATTRDGFTSATYSLPTRDATRGNVPRYAGNTAFGEPSDVDPADDVIIRRDEYTASWNPTRGTPNWVSYDLDASHFGSEDRCDCFTYDPALPPSGRYTTADYTGAGTIAAFAIDRGHLARSFDRTGGALDNASTFYFSNIVPQAADNNQGPWAALEAYLSDQARLQNREVYVVAGVAGRKGTLKNAGRIVIPAQVWKVVLILRRDATLADVTSATDVLQVLAVLMPNDAGIRAVPWEQYRTSVDSVERVSGYDLFALLPDSIEGGVERSRSSTPTRIAAGRGSRR